jgi:predicted nucleic-acid-binding Zn-ribbon protein
MAKVSRCVFCGSTSYGRGCRYGPKGHHFHPDDSSRCSWCGSTSYGLGCRLNPNGKEHVHGIQYNAMIKEKYE